jgi:hypothetical protein
MAKVGKYFEAMKELRVEPDVNVMNTLLDAYGRSVRKK